MTILEFLKKIYIKKGILLIGIILSVVLGLIILLLQSKQYTSSITMVPEKDRSQATLLQRLQIEASGISVRQLDKNAIYPYIYPLLFESDSFYINLLDSIVETKNHKKIRLEEFIKSNYKRQIQFESILLDITGDGHEDENGVLRKTEQNYILAKILKDKILLTIDSKTFVTEISITTVDPYVSATLAIIVSNKIKSIVTESRKLKVHSLKKYLEAYTDSLKDDYYQKDLAYANFLDSHNGTLGSSYRVQSLKYKNDKDLSYQDYVSALRALEYVKARDKEQLSIAWIICPAIVANYPSHPRIIISLLGWILIGTIASIAYILIKYNKKC